MNWNFKDVGENAKTLAAIAAVISLPFGGAWYVFRLEERVRTVETQIQALALPTARTVGSEPTKLGGSNTEARNPIAQACADLALRAADLHAKGNYVYGRSVEDLMSKLGCEARSITGK